MKPNAAPTTIQGFIPGKRFEMDIDPAARAHIMQSIQKLYSDIEMASLREIATNARDAHVAAGREHLPIEVTLPTPLDPYLRIKDYGDGLSVDDIEHIYSRYGVSTKRDTNDLVGALGFGCKAPLAYTDQFTLTSVCNGVQIRVIVSKDSVGGNMIIADTRTTTDHSGVTVEIPAAGLNSFASKAEKLFRFWEPGTVLVNGKEPEPIKGRYINDDLMIIKGHQSYVVMGNVPYPVDREYLTTGLNYEHAIVARVPIGDVEFTPSRELLDYTLETQARIKQIEADLAASLGTAVQAAIDKCSTRPEVIQTILDWHRAIPEGRIKGGYTFKGKPVPHIYDVPDSDKVGGPRAIVTQHNSHKLSKHERRSRLDLSWWANSLFVINYDREGFTPTVKKKLKQFADEQGIECSNYILLPYKPARSFTQWLPKGMVVEFAKVAAIKLPRHTTGGRVADPNRIPGSYDVIVDGKVMKGVEADKIDQTKPIFYGVGKVYDYRTLADALKVDYPGSTLVTFSPNRLSKFTRSFPQAIPAQKAIEEACKAWKRALTTNEKTAIAIVYGAAYNVKSELDSLDPAKIDDPAVKRSIRIARNDKYAKVRSEYNRYRAHTVLKASDLIKYESPLKNYPLFDQYELRRNPEAIYNYINALYAFTKPSA